MSTADGDPARTRPEAVPRPALRREVWLVLGLSLGQSAVYAVVNIVGKLTAGPPLSSQQATLNPSVSPRPLLDLTYQLLGIGFALVPVLLAVHFLGRTDPPASRVLGVDRGHAGRDVVQGVLLAAVIGLPGLGLYFLATAVGINATVVPSGLSDHWWTVPVLVLSAVQNAVLEEVVVVGYLITRLRQLSWSPMLALLASALLRGSYHLYQGFGGFFGNFVMGLVFGWWYQRRGRVAPLVIAHALLDIVAFVGYAVFGHVLGLK